MTRKSSEYLVALVVVKNYSLQWAFQNFSIGTYLLLTPAQGYQAVYFQDLQLHRQTSPWHELAMYIV